MSVCKDLKGYSRRHEWLGDTFSLLAVVLFFATLFLTISYRQEILAWLRHDVILNSLLAITALILDIVLIFACLSIGSARFAEEDESCFGTFKGRMAGTGSIGGIFNSWLRHMEHVGRKHR
jgi:hypothetical protein